MTEVATLGLKVDGTANIDNARDSLGRFVKSSQDAEKSTDSLSKGSQKSSKSLADVARESDRASSGMANLASAARTAGALIAASLGGISFGRVIKETAGFEQSLLGLQVVSGATAKQMKELERQSRTLGATSMFSAQQAADAQNYLAMAGFNVNEVLSATPGLLELAAAGSMDLASAADLASNVLGGFRLQVSELGRVNDVLAAAAAGSNTSIQQLGQAMSYAAPIAAAAGVSIEQTAAAIGVLSDAGLQGSRAGTGLLGVIRQLSNVTPAAEAALNAYGLTVADVNVEQRGLNEVLEALSAANINAADSFKIFGSEAGPAAQILASGAVRVNEFTGELELAEGAARRAAQILGSGLEGSFKSLTSAIGESTLQLGRDSGLSAGLQEVIDYATGVISVYNGMLDIFSDANDLSDDQTRSLNNTATALALAAGATGGLSAAYVVLTGAIWAANAAMTAFFRLLRVNPLVLAASAAVALGGALYTARDRTIELGETTGTVGDYLLGAWQEVTTRVEDYWGDTVDSVIGWLDEMGIDAGSVASAISTAFTTSLDALAYAFRLSFNTAVGTFFAMQTVAVGVASAITTAFTTMGSNAKTIFTALWNDIQAILSLDFSTSHFTNAIENELLSVAAAVGNSVAETANKAFDQLTDDHFGNIVGYFDDLGTAIEKRVATNQQIAKLTEFSRGLLRLGSSASAAGEALVVLGDENDDTGDSLDQFSASSKRAADAERERKKALDDSLSTYSALFKQISPAGAAMAEYNATVASLTVAYEDGTKSALEYYAAIGQAAKNYNDAVRAADPNIKRVEELTRQYDAAHIKAEQLTKDLSAINQAWRDNPQNGEQYARVVAGIRDEMQELALAADPISQEMAKSWEEAAKRIDETFADAFVGAFDSFSDFADQLESGFKRLLGELAYAAAKNQIMVSFGLGGSDQGQIGGQQGGMSLQNINPGMLKKGWDTASGWFGGGSTATAGSAAQGYAGSGWASSATSGGGWYGSATSNGATVAGNAANGLYTAGASFAGGYAGTEIGSSLTGKTANSNYGATAGSIAGAYIGSIVPVIGTYIGAAIGSAIGGFADSLFGSNKKTFDFDFLQGQHSYVFGDNTSAFGDYGLTGLSDYKLGEQQDALKEMLAALGEFDNQLAASAIPERFEAMKKSIEGFTHSGPEDLFETRLRTILAGSGALFADEISKIVDVEQLSKAFLASLQIESVGQNLAEAVSTDVNNAFKDALTSGADIEVATQQIMASLQALELLGGASGRLNLQFDATAQGALSAAGSLAEYAGGLDNLAAIQQNYYQSAFSEAERLQHSLEDVRGALNSLSNENITSVEHLRQLVEAQDLSSEAGRQLVIDLMALAPALQQGNAAVKDAIDQQYQSALGRAADADGLAYWFSQVTNGAISLEGAFWNIANSSEALERAVDDAGNAVKDTANIMREREQLERQLLQLQGNTAEIRRRELQDTHESNRALRERIWAFQDEQERLQELERQQQERIRTIEQEASAMARAREQWASFGNSIQSWIDGLNASDAGLGTPQDQLDASDAAFWAQYQKAIEGDRDARQSITQYADRYAENLRDFYASGTGAQLGIEEIKDALSQLPELISPESFLADEFRKTIDNQTGELIDADKDLAAAIAAIIKPQGANTGTTPGGSDSIVGSPGAAQDSVEKELAGAGGLDNSTAQKINAAYHDVLGRGAQGAQFSAWADWLDQKAVRAGQLHQAVAWANLPVGGREWLEERGLYGNGTVPQFANGGYTGSGGKYDPAGIVHAGEIVWSQSDIARAGGVAAVESMRNGFGRAPDISSFPLLNNNDVTQVIGDLRRTIEAQGKQITELLTRVDKNTRDGANATASGAAEARIQRDAILRENEAQSRLLRIEKESNV